MKNVYFTLIFVWLALAAQAQQPYLREIWRSSQALPVPESVLFVPDKNVLYVSLIDGESAEADGRGGIAVLNLDGSLKNAEWITGLNAPKGMALHQDLLYIADINEVIVVDVITGNIIEEIAIEGSVFLNDVTVDATGTVYVSDTRQNIIYRVKHGRYEVYMDDVTAANGLKHVGRDLYVLAGKELWRVDAQKNVTVVARGFEQNGDGLEPVGNGDFIVTCWPGIIYYVHADGRLTKMLDVQGKMSTADLGYHPDKKVLYVPTFHSNSVVAYQLQ